MRAALVVAVLGFAASVWVGSARGDVTKVECIAANTRAQDLRREEHLAAARAELTSCADPKCPAMIRTDCTRRLDELDRSQPSLVFDVKDDRGADVIDVRVSMDGKRLADRLDGSAIPIDPGVHVFTFVVPGVPVATDRVLVREGEPGRHERVVMQPALAPVAPAKPAPPPEPAVVAPPPPPPSGLGPQKTAGTVLAVAGLAGLAVGASFAALAASSWSAAQSACGGNTSDCKDVAAGSSDRQTAQTDATVANVTLLSGGALFVTGALLFLAGHRATEGETTGLRVAPSFDGSRAGLVALGSF